MLAEIQVDSQYLLYVQTEFILSSTTVTERYTEQCSAVSFVASAIGWQ